MILLRAAPSHLSGRQIVPGRVELLLAEFDIGVAVDPGLLGLVAL